MGRRTEVRVAAHMPVLVRGTDPDGNPFAVTAQVHDISGSGASLTGLNGLGVPGTKIEVEYHGRKARYRIQWVGEEGSPRANMVGLRCLEPGNYIWEVKLPKWTEDGYDPSQAPIPTAESAAAPPTKGGPPAMEERRAFSRHPCRFEALASIEGTDMSSPAVVTDISLGGCYLEMLSPLPVGILIDLSMNPSNTTLHVHGKVRTSQMGMGMGVEFTGLTPEDFEKLRKSAPPDAPARQVGKKPLPPAADVVESVMELELEPERAHQAPAGAPPSAVAGQPSTADALEAIVRVLFRRGVISRGEVAEELQKLLTAKS
ncbi:MAG: PilZ domain-containing protein [Candidatus Acidiferrales bacterium]